MESEERIREAVIKTQVLRPPKQSLSTFGSTNVYYYLVAEATYNELISGHETVIREGRVVAERPKIVTPYYLSRVQGFSPEATKYFKMLMDNINPNSPGLFYAYRNEPKEMNLVSDKLEIVVDRLNSEIDKKGDPLASIIKGEDMLWDVSILKFIYEITDRSLPFNVMQLQQQGLLHMDASGMPADARVRIEGLFELVQKGELEPAVLKTELDRWGVFEEYQDRFFRLFK
ncbi:MAG TPA: hypothetical protein VLH15_00590 [Dehalococcoidales bacterium]|nr:hypothetical protein [Dehalococcoidales bacterium]